jgi:hypothetical protein
MKMPLILAAMLAVVRADAAPEARARPRQVVTEMGDTATVHLCDCIATVEVRAMSLGPGGCAVKIHTPQGTTGIFAPPASWTGWISVYESTAEHAVRIEREIVCDTGARTQLRYWR